MYTYIYIRIDLHAYDLNNKVTEVNNRMELMCKQISIQFISYCQTIDSNKHLNESYLHFNSFDIRVLTENFSLFLKV